VSIVRVDGTAARVVTVNAGPRGPAGTTDYNELTNRPTLAGAGVPEGVVVAAIGVLYINTDGGAGTTLYVKESGAGNTGWAAK
jgi:hypothetical protein